MSETQRTEVSSGGTREFSFHHVQSAEIACVGGINLTTMQLPPFSRENVFVLVIAVFVFAAVAAVFRIRPDGILSNPLWIAAALIAITLISIKESDIENFLEAHPRTRLCLVVVASGLVSLALVGSSIWAKWSIIDDHGIVYFLGPDGKINLAEIPDLMMRTEVGELTQRFRPTYVLVQLLEMFFWGDSPGLWYVSRVVMFATSIGILWLCLNSWIGFLPSAVVVLYSLTYGFWFNIWCRLGPSESYSVVGTALFAFASVRLLQGSSDPLSPGRRVQPFYWLMFALGAILAVGSKENLLFLLVPTWIVGAVLLKRGRLGGLGLFSVAAITGFSAFVIVRIMLGLASGEDVYGRSVSGGHRLGLLLDLCTKSLGSIWLLALIAVLVGVASIGAFLWGRGERREVAEYVRSALQTALIVLALGAVYVSQYVFYNGEWPTGIRYDFPGILARPLIAVAFAFFGFKVMSLIGIPERYRRAVKFGLVAAVAALIVVRGFQQLIEPCRDNVRTTRAFCHKLDEIVHALREDPKRPLLIVCCKSSNCYEPVCSLQRFFLVRQIQNPLYLKLEDVRGDSAYERTLIEALEKVSREGSKSVGFLPLQNLDLSGNVWIVGLKCHHTLPNGTSLGVISW